MPVALPGPEEIAALVGPYLSDCSPALAEQLAVYLELLVRWNARTNLSAIREPAEIVRRHFGESLFVAQHVPEGGTLMDLGSGAGFPGVPIQLYRPGLQVTLVESQGKKAAFLREVTRTLGLGCKVFAGRAETLPPGLLYDAVTLRAVDRPEAALELARVRVMPAGKVYHLTTSGGELADDAPALALPGSSRKVLRILGREL